MYHYRHKSRLSHPTGRHECEVLEKGVRAPESGFLWDTCEKNPGHQQFVPVSEFTDRHLPRGSHAGCCERLRALAGLVVRIRVQCTSPDRADDDSLSEYRGTDRLRLGSGVISFLSNPKTNEPCPCRICDGQLLGKYWTFTVQTACHVVYNTEEARKPMVDLFYDDESCRRAGKMKTVWAIRAEFSDSDTDKCKLLCVTHDEALAEKIRAVDKSWGSFCLYHPVCNQQSRDIAFRVMKELAHGGPVYVVIISHPHGQPKKMTVGQVVSGEDGSGFTYLAATCPGSSGAPLLLVESDLFSPGFFPWFGYVHSGTYREASTKTSKCINYINSFTHYS